MLYAERTERLAGWLLRSPLTWLVAGLSLVQLCTWVPHYLTWPLWADDDVFSTMAHAWDAGELPYRDMLSNNFPGTMYLFWILGRIAGWESSVAFYAVDVFLLLILGATLIRWSVKHFTTALPGLIGFAALLSYYLTLDYSKAAQRDWHGPLLAAVALLLIQIWSGRPARVASALILAAAAVIRPHVLLFVPAFLLTIGHQDGRAAPRDARHARLEWTISLIVFVAIGLAPLALAGVLSDFVRSIRVAGYGPLAVARSPASRISVVWLLASIPRLLTIPLAAVLLAFHSDRTTWRLTAAWVLMFAGAVAYDPVSPVYREYLVHPLWMMWCVNVAVLAGLLIRHGQASSSVRLAAVVLLATICIGPVPRFSAARTSWRVLTGFYSGAQADLVPPGYSHTYHNLPFYPWNEFRPLLNYLRTHTGPQTRIANVLLGAAVTGPTGRLSAFPAESVTWLEVVEPRDEERFIASLERFPDSVVVWAPDDPERRLHPPRLLSVIDSLYEPEARFGRIAVWRRRASH